MRIGFSARSGATQLKAESTPSEGSRLEPSSVPHFQYLPNGEWMVPLDQARRQEQRGDQADKEMVGHEAKDSPSVAHNAAEDVGISMWSSRGCGCVIGSVPASRSDPIILVWEGHEKSIATGNGIMRRCV